MNWAKMPTLVRQLRIAWMIPSLRRNIAKSIGYSVASWIAGALCLIVVSPLFLLALIGTALAWIAETVSPVIATPCVYLRERRSDLITEAHETMSVEEIRRIAFGEEPPIICNKPWDHNE